MGILQQFITKENLQQKHGGIAPNVLYGGDNLFPPIVPSNNYIKEGEKLNIVSPEIYKKMCIESIPFKPFVISEEYLKIWEKEQQDKLLKEKQKIKMKKSSEKFGFCLNDFIIEFENSKMKKINKNLKCKRYEPKKIDLNSVKDFFDKMKNQKNGHN